MAVSDNASNIVNAITQELKLNHFGCFAHKLNIIVQASLQLCTSVLQKVKRIVEHFKRSTKSNIKLMKHQIHCGINPPKKILQDVATRWNSTFYMIDRFVELEMPIKSTIAILDMVLPNLTMEDWSLLKNLQIMLKPFEGVTKAISGENYMTGSLVLTSGQINVCEKVKKT